MMNKTLVFYGVGATIAALDGNAVFEVNDGARLRVIGANLTAATGVGVIRCEGASATPPPALELFRTTLDNTSTTLLANPCTVTVAESVLRTRNTSSMMAIFVQQGTVARFDRTLFVGNGHGLLALDTNVQITNSVFKNAGGAADHGAFVGGTFDISFSTIIDSIVECSQQGAKGPTLNSSILYYAATGPTDTLIGQSECTTVKSSVIFPSSQPVGATNVSEPPALANLDAGDYRLLVISPAIDRGDPTSTNAVDFDGTPRPQGSQRDSGAFEYKP